MQDKLYRQQRDDAECHRPAGGHYAEKIEKSGPDHSNIGWQGVRIDDGSNGIGGVMKAIDELKPQGNQQRYTEQDEG